MNRFLRLSLLAVLVPLLGLSACGEPVGPSGSRLAADPLLSRGGSGPELSRIATFNQHRVITIAWAKKWIGPEGGRLEFQGFAVDVPAGAVSKTTQFSIRLPVDPQGSDRVVAEFGPHGSTFAQPVTIEFPLAGTSIENQDGQTVLWWDGSAGGWRDMGGSLTADGSLSTETDHFSTYGTSTRSGTVLMSGG